MKSVGITLMLLGLSSLVFAGQAVAAPEISPASSAGALALVSGAILVIRARRKK
jgi:hypothetical protein